ncbi:MAG: mechanosensitive ion channel family protein [Chlorobi bacterium]|nr:mechanosensitive ion channel family protein [Chlorobiota bacterium]
MDFLQQTYYGNSLQTWLTAVGITAGMMLVFYLARTVAVRKLQVLARRTKTEIDDILTAALAKSKSSLLTILAIYIGVQVLYLPSVVGSVLDSISVIVLLLQVAIWSNEIITGFLTRYRERKMGEDASARATVSLISFLSKLVMWTIIILLTLENLGVDITTLIAGVGVGGVAIALAAQNILGDLFASLSIMLDRPFVIGDFIVVDEYAGTIEHTGLKTTRIRSLTGEQLVFANTDLLGSRIRNYKRMSERRITFAFGVVYQTPYEKVKAIPGMVKTIIGSEEIARFDRAHFKGFGDSSLDFEVVYYMLDPDYNRYMDTQESINLKILERFEEEGIEFAYPTRTVFIEGSGNNTEPS